MMSIRLSANLAVNLDALDAEESAGSKSHCLYEISTLGDLSLEGRTTGLASRAMSLSPSTEYDSSSRPPSSFGFTPTPSSVTSLSPNSSFFSPFGSSNNLRFTNLLIQENKEKDIIPMLQPGSLMRALSTVEDEGSMDSESDAVVEPKNLLFKEIVQSLNNQDGEYQLESMGSKTSNDVFLIRGVGGVPIAVFKTIKSGFEIRRGVGNGTEFAHQNEVIVSKLGLLWNEKFVPEAEIVTLKFDKFRTGTMHEFVNGVSLKTEVELRREREEKAAQSNKNNELFYNVDFAENGSPQNLSTINGLRIQDIAAFHILTVSLDVNPGNIMVDENGFPTTIDYNDIAPDGLEMGIKPPCWMKCLVASKPFIDGTRKWRSLEWGTLKDTIQSVEGHSEKGLITMQNGHTLLHVGIEKGLTPNEIAHFLIGRKMLINAARLAPPLKYCLNMDGLVDEARLRNAMDYLISKRNENVINYSSMDYQAVENCIDKIVKDLQNYITRPLGGEELPS